MNMKVRILCGFILCAMLIVMNASIADSSVKVGDEIIFGMYEQDGNLSNGKEPISWIVVSTDKKSGTMRVVSNYLLDCVQYNTSTKKTKWANTTLNQWLQSSFVPEAFSDSEQAMIIPVKVSGETQGVFIPSQKEMKKYFKSYLCEPTRYAMNRGCFNYYYQGMTCGSYWLRMDTSSTWGTFVGAKGSVHTKKNKVTTSDNGVRPAINLSLNYDADSENADLNDLKIAERTTVAGIGRIQITGFSQSDRLGYYPAGNLRDTSQFYDSGSEAEYIFIRMCITNTEGYSIDYLTGSNVEVVYDGNYRFGGWVQQYPEQSGDIVFSAEDRHSIVPGENGYFCFGCTVPNAVANNDKPLEMHINLMGQEIVFNIR